MFKIDRSALKCLFYQRKIRCGLENLPSASRLQVWQVEWVKNLVEVADFGYCDITLYYIIAVEGTP